jgi:hypothetical protein
LRSSEGNNLYKRRKNAQVPVQIVVAAFHDDVAYEAGVATEEYTAVVDAFAEVEDEAQ